ncbi:MAG: energy transducer TonB [Candidatus Koribacter versatilis]|uniref:Energy transducer TonB n=1 Tax=Candidatus Korobacter versatilis TaxID=658062 RepID=A0A932EQ49_9BACT|nr:energy transducer TonB [Candidatus Koribacter versatilis]
MAPSADIYADEQQWTAPLAWSTVFHAVLFSSLFLYAGFFGRTHGETWGGATSGGAMSATLVSNAAIPLPAPQEQTENVLANESKGLTESVPKEQEKPTPEAIAIPDKTTKPVNERAKPTEPAKKPQPHVATNQIPFGQGGPVSGPFGVFNANGAKGGFGFTGGGGDFGSRFGWYVDGVRRKVSENWLKYEVDPSISTARRVYITFSITRSGEPENVQVEQSSGIPSLDISAVRAIQRIDTFGPLPDAYSGNRVSVEFWFDYKR